MRKLPEGEPEEEGGDTLIGRPAGRSDPWGGRDNNDHWPKKAAALSHDPRVLKTNKQTAIKNVKKKKKAVSS